jgi:hypothetical protein
MAQRLTEKKKYLLRWSKTTTFPKWRCFEMSAYIVQEPFRAKSGEIRRGQIITMSEDKAKTLVTVGKIAELQPCPICRHYAWWLSVYGVLVCGVCHPPAPGSVKKWIADPETLIRMKADKPAALLSFEYFRRKRESESNR